MMDVQQKRILSGRYSETYVNFRVIAKTAYVSGEVKLGARVNFCFYFVSFFAC